MFWRYWRMDGGKLFAPMAGDPLPTTCTLIAGCHRPHLPPFPGCHCGVSIYTHAHDLQTAMQRMDLDPAEYVATSGTARGPIISDSSLQLYTSATGFAVTPPSYRCRTYTVTGVYTTQTLAYDIPTLGALPC